jgi:hypothetical protein
LPILGSQGSGAKGAPTAPTVGTATITNSTTVSLTFTAPSSKLPITSYTVTSSPSIALSTSGTSSPLTVTGTFASNQAYTFTITATNANGTSAASSASSSIIPNTEVSANNFVSFEVKSNANTYAYDLALDSTGVMYVAGQESDGGSRDSQINKYAVNGTKTWGRKYYRSSGSRYEYSTGVVVDSSNNIYTISNPDYGQQSVRISKVNSDGTFSYSRNYSPASGNGYINGSAVDPSGNIIVCGRGYSNGTAWNNSTIKFNSSGAVVWQRRWGDNPEDFQGYRVACDSSGNIYVAGTRGTLGTASSYRGFIIKYNSSGTLQWQYQYNESTLGGGIYRIAIDSNDNIYATGYFGTTTSTVAVLFKLNTDGDIVWQRKITGEAGYYWDVSFDGSGNVYVAGSDVGNSAAAWFKYNSSGTLQLQRKMTNSDFVQSCLYKTASLHFLGNRSTPGEGLLFKVPADGSLTGTYTLNSISRVYSASSLSDAAGTLSKSTISYSDTADGWTERSSGDTTNSSYLVTRYYQTI